MEIMGVQQWGTVYLSILQKGIYMDLYEFLNDGDDNMGFLHDSSIVTTKQQYHK